MISVLQNPYSYASQCIYWVTQRLPQIYTENYATFPIQIQKITVQICGNFWVTQYICVFAVSLTLPHMMTNPCFTIYHAISVI